MGNQANLKAYRKQIRNLAQELLPEMVKDELFKALSAQIHAQVEQISANVKFTLKSIDERSKDIQSYIVRQSTAPANPAAEAIIAAPDAQSNG